ncbi:response regulator transcription factor [Caulobacter sp. NIBR2454]|uniref:response regulator transcription factor n=1 Tax=Caulobacter sp. NIBR2454 TaxID=3015996 RepID=UPI0022B7503C|nr:response regulator transcription factor [Caulobacter sp. NIBR2454]
MFDLNLNVALQGPPTVLVVEDDASLRALLLRTLRENGYHALSSGSGPEMVRALQGASVDLILLDVMLPGSNGFDLCRAIRRESNVPLIMLSARAEEADRLLGLELGADDYVAKPFSARELVARIRAVLRRTNADSQPMELSRGQLGFGQWILDPAHRELISPEGAAVDLSGAEFDLLVAFVSQPQRVIGRERLLELSRARIADASDRSIDVLVSRLRRKLRRSEEDGAIIRTVRGVGYMFSLPVRRI